MIYRYNKESLSYEQVIGVKGITLLSITLLSIIGFGLASFNRVDEPQDISEETRAIVIREANNVFSFNKLKDYIKALNVRYPYIVLAQAQLETGGFTSPIYKENHNLFGLKQATRRPTTALGTDSNHAYYNNWRESVLDYAFLQGTYMRSVKTEDEYYQYLGQYYAEDERYVSKLKDIVDKLKLKDFVKE